MVTFFSSTLLIFIFLLSLTFSFNFLYNRVSFELILAHTIVQSIIGLEDSASIIKMFSQFAKIIFLCIFMDFGVFYSILTCKFP